MVTNEMIKQIPKVELHDHLDGSLKPETIIELAASEGVELPADNPGDLASWFHRGADRKNLSLYLEGFSVTTSIMQTRDAIRRVAYEHILSLKEDNVAYGEIRFAPILHTEKGLNLEEVVESAIAGLEKGKQETGVEYGLILCAMRHQNISLEIAELAVAFRGKGVVGFDIAGDEFGHPPKKHLDAFQYIKNKNFNITIHAGEAFGIESIWQAVQICGAHRIGHATRLVEDMVVHNERIEKMGSLANYIRDKRVPLEICLSSNVQTGAASSLDAHPFGVYFRNHFRVMLCTDNRLMSNTTLTKEMSLAVKHFNLNIRDLEKLTINAMKSAFVPYEKRLKIIYDVLKPGFSKIREITNPND